MGLFDFIKKQFIDVIHWTEESNGVLAWRYPMQDFEIQYGARLTVRESQLALFVNEGRIADQFAPGLYTLTTQTLPLLTNLENWDKLFQSPFKSDVYFFSTRQQIDRKWGTTNPVTLRDKEFGIVRLRAFGNYSYRITDPTVFHREISGTRDIYTADDLDGQLAAVVVAILSDHLANSGVSFIDLAAHQDRLGDELQARLQAEFGRLGLALENFVVQNVSLPEELQKVLDQRIGINMAGNLQELTQFQVAQSIPVAAANEGGLAGAGAGLGAGLAMAQGIGQALGGTLAPTAPAATAAPAAPAAEDPMQTLEKLHGLMTRGVITAEEFAAKKAEILGKL
jgi:membrane protease subunit (stomatin/prohibitin family)